MEDIDETKLDPEMPFKKAMQRLSFWVIDEGRIVTSAYLLKNTELNVGQVQRLLTEFVEENRTDERISSTFMLLGEPMPGFYNDAAAEEDGIERIKSAVCRQEELEQIKAKFKSVDTCSVYSVQAKPIRDFQSLFNVDWCVEGNPYLSPAKEKTLVWNPTAYKNHERWKESRQDQAQLAEIAGKHLVQSVMMKNAAKVEDKKPKSKDVKTKDAKKPESFFKNVVKASPERKDMETTTSNAVEKSPQTKRRRHRILIDDEEEEESDKERDSGNKVEDAMQVDEPAASTPVANMFEADPNDLYDAGGGSSPEREQEPVEEERPKRIQTSKTKQQSKGKAKKRTSKNKGLIVTNEDEDNGDEQEDEQMEVPKEEEVQQPRTIKTFKHEKVSDSYVDADGYTVTRTVPRLIETEEVIVPRAKPILQASNAANASAKPAKPKKAPKGQPTINSFFTRQ